MDSSPRLCLLTLDSGPAAHSADARLALLLTAHGWRVHLLACAAGQRLTELPATVSVTHLDDFPEAPEAIVPEWGGDFDRRSLHALTVVKQLHAATPFDIIQYPDEGGLGYRLAQANRTGVGAEGAFLVARLRGPTAWRRTESAQWLGGAGEPVREFGEQTSFELADGHTSLSNYLIDEARKLGWTVPPETAVVPDCPDAEGDAPALLDGPVDEVVFAGPLDKLHGLRVFVRAVQTLPASVAVTFVGQEALLEGRGAATWATERLKNRKVTFHPARDDRSILDFLRDRNVLAVVPYLHAAEMEFVRALARHRVPFVATDFGPVRELVTDPDAREALVAPGTVAGLARTLAGYVAAPAARRREWADRLATAHGPEVVHPVVLACYDRLLQRAREARAARAVRSTHHPKVTVGITHYNLGRYLPETLASVAAQTYPNLEVVIADDGSNDPASVAAVAEMERLYPTFKFLRGPNVGVCGNRNRCLDAATGELFFPLDADNIAAPDMIERLVDALQRQPADVGAVSCFWLGFANSEGLKAGQYVGCYRPSGGPRILVGLWNPYGETSGLFRTSQLRELGGYDDLHPEYMSEDWHLYIKIVARGLKVAVLPQALYFYRIRPDSRYRTGDHGVNHVRVLPDVAAIDFTPAERLEVWTLLASLMHATTAADERCRAVARERDALAERLTSRRHRVLDGLQQALHVLNPVTWVRGATRRAQRDWGSPASPAVVSAGAENGAPPRGGTMLRILRGVARPWRVLRKARALKDTIIVHLRQVLDLQREVNTEVRELHRSSLLAAVHLLEEQRQAREALAQDYTRLEQRLEALERQLTATDGARTELGRAA
jgi:glycosyltransferase involved in cell wall biosynthesis